MTTTPDAVPLPCGTRLEKFELLEVMGQGGGGICYIAIDHQLGREVVIKEHFPRGLCMRKSGTAMVYPTQEQAYAASLQAFCRGARILGGLNHAGIAKIHEVFSACGTAFGVMEMVDGLSLRDWMAQKPSVKRIVRVLQSVLSTLRYMHGLGVIHRDIKPANILVKADDTPVIIDFDSAMPGEPTHVPTLVGTPGYAAPEQFCEGKIPTPSSDIFALGRTLARVVDEQGIPLPRRLKNSILRACAELPQERYQSADAWLRALEGPHRRRWCIAALAFACAAAGLVWWVVERQPEEEYVRAARHPADLVDVGPSLNLVAGFYKPVLSEEREFLQAALAAQKAVDDACAEWKKDELKIGEKATFDYYAKQVELNYALNQQFKRLVEDYIATVYGGNDPKPERTEFIMSVLEVKKMSFLRGMAKEYPLHPHYLVQYNWLGSIVYPEEEQLKPVEEALVASLLKEQTAYKERRKQCASMAERQALRLEFNEKVAALIDDYQSRYYDEDFFWPEFNIEVIRKVLSKGIPEKEAAPLMEKAALQQKYPSVKLRSAWAAHNSGSQNK